jgi:hypothetical protein
MTCGICFFNNFRKKFVSVNTLSRWFHELMPIRMQVWHAVISRFLQPLVHSRMRSSEKAGNGDMRIVT